MALLFTSELFLIKVKLFPLKKISIHTSCLTWSRCDTCKKTASGHLIINGRRKYAGILTLFEIPQNMARFFLLLLVICRSRFFRVLLFSNLNAVMILIPGLKRVGID